VNKRTILGDNSEKEVVMETLEKQLSENLSKEVHYREAPHNILAEQMLLGTILTNNEHLHRVSDFLKQDHFYEPVHQRIYETVMKYNDKGLVANPVSLKNAFDQDEGLREVGGAGYLAQLASLSTTIINMVDYGKTIVDLALRRKLIGIGGDIVNNAYQQDIDLTAAEQVERAEQDLFSMDQSAMDNSKVKSLKSSLIDSISTIQTAFKRQEKITGISTGFIDLDQILGGLQNSDLLILAGRPSMGKTGLAVNIALNASKYMLREYEKKKKKGEEEEGKAITPSSIAFFSLEMSSEQLATRMVSMMSEVNSSKLRTGQINEEQFSKILKCNKDLYQLPFFIDDTPSLSIAALRTRCRRLKKRHNLGLIIVDYLQLLRGASKASENSRIQEISEISQGLKAIAKELNVPVIALSQLSRAVEQREDKRPLLSDLRESGSIEQDADIVTFIYREEYYLSRRQPQEGTPAFEKWQADMNEAMNLAEVIIAKQRNGPIGNVKLRFDSSLVRFSDLTVDNY
jgi:replicative DNA helicase